MSVLEFDPHRISDDELDLLVKQFDEAAHEAGEIPGEPDAQEAVTLSALLRIEQRKRRARCAVRTALDALREATQ